jgi:hypothetical protein
VTQLQLPLALPLWELATFEADRLRLCGHLGPPHFIETDSTKTAGGEEEVWAYSLTSGQRILIILQVDYRVARLIADPPEIGPVLDVLGITPGDARLNCYAAPFAMD